MANMMTYRLEKRNYSNLVEFMKKEIGFVEYNINGYSHFLGVNSGKYIRIDHENKELISIDIDRETKNKLNNVLRRS